MTPLYNPVRIKINLPSYSLWKGEVGTVVATSEGAYTVEFFEDRYGLTKAVVTLPKSAFEPYDD